LVRGFGLWFLRVVLRFIPASVFVFALVELMFLTPAAAAVAGADTAAPLGSSKRPRKLPSMEIREAHHLRDTGMVYYLFDTGQRVGEGPRIRLCDIEPHPLTWARGGVPESVLKVP